MTCLVVFLLLVLLLHPPPMPQVYASCQPSPCPSTGHGWRSIDAAAHLILLCVPFRHRPTPTVQMPYSTLVFGCDQTVHSKSDWVTSSFGTAQSLLLRCHMVSSTIWNP
jgi:hypothetical protein